MANLSANVMNITIKLDDEGRALLEALKNYETGDNARLTASLQVEVHDLRQLIIQARAMLGNSNYVVAHRVENALKILEKGL